MKARGGNSNNKDSGRQKFWWKNQLPWEKAPGKHAAVPKESGGSSAGGESGFASLFDERGHSFGMHASGKLVTERQARDVLKDLEARLSKWKAASGGPTTLRELDVSNNNGCCTEFVSKLTHLLLSHSVIVHRFCFSACVNFDDETAKVLAHYVGQLDKRLVPLELQLSGCSITSEGFAALMTAITENAAFPYRDPLSGRIRPLSLRIEDNFIAADVLKEWAASPHVHDTSATKRTGPCALRGQPEDKIRAHIALRDCSQRDVSLLQAAKEGMGVVQEEGGDAAADEEESQEEDVAWPPWRSHNAAEPTEAAQGPAPTEWQEPAAPQPKEATQGGAELFETEAGTGEAMGDAAAPEAEAGTGEAMAALGQLAAATQQVARSAASGKFSKIPNKKDNDQPAADSCSLAGFLAVGRREFMRQGFPLPGTLEEEEPFRPEASFLPPHDGGVMSTSSTADLGEEETPQPLSSVAWISTLNGESPSSCPYAGLQERRGPSVDAILRGVDRLKALVDAEMGGMPEASSQRSEVQDALQSIDSCRAAKGCASVRQEWCSLLRNSDDPYREARRITAMVETLRRQGYLGPAAEESSPLDRFPAQKSKVANEEKMLLDLLSSLCKAGNVKAGETGWVPTYRV